MTEIRATSWSVFTGPRKRVLRMLRKIQSAAKTKYWFPHVPLAIGLALAGLWLLSDKFAGQWSTLFSRQASTLALFSPAAMPFLLAGIAMLLMPIGLLFRSRFSWIIALVLVVATGLMLLRYPRNVSPLLLPYLALLLVLFILVQGYFDRSSLTAGTLFAVTSSLMLLIYAVFGSLYLGAEFSPPIRDLPTAFYYSIVTMSTVGYGDIIPKTGHSRLFTISIILLGIAVFATSISAILGPVVARSMNRIMSEGKKRMKRSGHFIIAGATPLAFNTYRELKKRGQAVTLIVPQAPTESEFDQEDIIVGDPNNVETLSIAGAAQAQAVLAMRADDSENAFIALAVRELKSPAKTIVAVNDSKHLERVRLVQPDFLIAPQVLGGEMLAMVLSGEPITSQFVSDRFLHFDRAPGGESKS